MMPDKFGWDNNFGNSPAPTHRRQLMIDDGLPPSFLIDQSERNKFWIDNPPLKYSSPYIEKKINMKEEEINLLLELKASKEREAASLGCSGHTAEIAVLERLGFAKQHGYGPTSFYITDAGLEEAKKYIKQQQKRKEADIKWHSEFNASVKTPPKTKAPPEKTGKRESKEKAPKASRAIKVDPNLSAICKECGVTSKNRSAALDFLNAKIGKQQPITAVMKAVYGTGGSEAALDTVIRALQRDIGNSAAKDKYEVKRIKDAKGVYNYGLYKKT